MSDQLTRSGQYRSWMSYIRGFGRWLQVHGNPNAYVLSNRWKAPFVPAHPYLLARSQIEAFSAAAARLDAQSPWRWQAGAFFMLMHSCGIRTGEARVLLSGHVDLHHGHLDIVSSKGNRSRRLPLTGQVVDVLTSCDQASRRRLASRRTFFISSSGNPVTAATVGVMFNRVWDQAGLPRPMGGTRPRPHDFRHHFAYANIEWWMTPGKDVTALLPYLSRYMGHATLSSTYFYVHTSPDFMAAYANLTGNGGSVLPEVGFA